MTGLPPGLRDTRDYYNHDMRFIFIATIIIVLLILIALLRAIVAPLYLIASVMLSYLSALGIGVIVFQFILGQQLHWSIPGLAFILLVAVGADYNLLLISRIRDESPHCVRVGVIRTVGSTGGVITSAGLIFAVSMFGLVFASISTMVQAGFVIGVGILLDTFLVRTVTVPAMAAIVGRANWWPSRARAKLRAPVRRSQPVPVSHRLTNENRSLRDRVTLPTIITVHYRHLRTRSDEHFLDEPLPLLGTGTDGQPESLTPTNIEIAPAVHETATDNQPLPVASSQYLQLDPQNSETIGRSTSLSPHRRWGQPTVTAQRPPTATHRPAPMATSPSRRAITTQLGQWPRPRQDAPGDPGRPQLGQSQRRRPS